MSDNYIEMTDTEVERTVAETDGGSSQAGGSGGGDGQDGGASQGGGSGGGTGSDGGASQGGGSGGDE